MNTNVKRSYNGFTLVELLVVISIIALLLAILMPSLSKAKKLATDVTCRSNLKGIDLLYGVYLQQNNDRYPTSYRFTTGIGMPENSPMLDCWYSAIWKNSGKNNDAKFFLCPAATKPEVNGQGHPVASYDASYFQKGLPHFSYGHNDWVLSRWNMPNESGLSAYAKTTGFPDAATEARAWKSRLSAKNPSKNPVIGDSSYPIATDVAYINTPPNVPRFSGDHGWVDSQNQANQMKRFCLDRHSLAVNWTFMDSSVRKVGLKQLWDLQFHRDWNPTHKDTDAFMTKMYPKVWNGWMRNCRNY
ncbi:MAG: hypothetical protein A2Y10_01100 [Planctomycetes bacterium GWF2_41_51]|nr:MAG: hypothetical protein A2Y10_01100 [Planctomycetes bacterium GWF2_41_51]HBG26543.1 hypothetical protein [Phycisphaerales bacterium]